MDLCVGLFCVGLALVLVGVVGHFLWVAAAAVFTKVYLEPAPQPAPPGVKPVPAVEVPRKRCVGCGALLRAGVERCPNCHLDPAGPVARELQDLETAARQV